jgi:CheY-like chemotaxis protein
MKILIVDDNPIQRMVLEFSLRKCNHQMVVVAGGQEALQVLEDQPDVGLVITDIMMPDVSGLELLRLMKANPRHNNIPVILCTVLSDGDNVRKAAQLGCRFYIVKPIQIKVMLRMVEEALEDQTRVLRSFEGSRQKLGMDASTFYSLMVSFEKSVNESLALAEQKIKSGDMDSIRDDLATLYENTVLLGAEKLSRALADFQCGANMSMTAHEDYQIMLNEMRALSSSLPKIIESIQSAN